MNYDVTERRGRVAETAVASSRVSGLKAPPGDRPVLTETLRSSREFLQTNAGTLYQIRPLSLAVVRYILP